MEADSMRVFKTLVAILAMASVIFAAQAMAQTQAPPPAGQAPSPPGSETPARGEEKTVEGQVMSIDPSSTELTLTDGTRLVTPPGAKIRPGVLTEGMTVVASYTEETGEKVLTGLAVKQPEPSAPGGSPKRQ
jgi:hypothetical protein